MNAQKQATDEQVAGWTAAKYAEDHGDDIRITDLEDVDILVGDAAGLVHEHGAAHLITQIAVWPVPAEAEALITLDLPSGIRLCTLCISRKHLIPDAGQASDGPATVRQVLGNVLSAARALAGEYETEVSRRPHEPGIWVLRHDGNHGDDLSLYASRESALSALAQDVRSRWDNITSIPGVPTTAHELDDQTAVSTYFRHRSGLESYSLYEETVIGAGQAGTRPGNAR